MSVKGEAAEKVVAELQSKLQAAGELSKHTHIHCTDEAISTAC